MDLFEDKDAVEYAKYKLHEKKENLKKKRKSTKQKKKERLDKKMQIIKEKQRIENPSSSDDEEQQIQ